MFPSKDKLDAGSPPLTRETPSVHSPTGEFHGFTPAHLRETLIVFSLRMITSRFTPAYAGNTAPVGPLPPDSTDHPRLRGKDDFVSIEG